MHERPEFGDRARQLAAHMLVALRKRCIRLLILIGSTDRVQSAIVRPAATKAPGPTVEQRRCSSVWLGPYSQDELEVLRADVTVLANVEACTLH